MRLQWRILLDLSKCRKLVTNVEQAGLQQQIVLELLDTSTYLPGMSISEMVVSIASYHLLNHYLSFWKYRELAEDKWSHPHPGFTVRPPDGNLSRLVEVLVPGRHLPETDS